MGPGDVNVTARHLARPGEIFGPWRCSRRRGCLRLANTRRDRANSRASMQKRHPLDILLPNGMLAQLDPVDEDLAAHTWRAWFFKRWKDSWVVVRDHLVENPHARKRIYLHRVIAFRVYFGPREEMCVRPIDGNFLNCRRSNLHVYKKKFQHAGWSRDGANEPNPYVEYVEPWPDPGVPIVDYTIG